MSAKPILTVNTSSWHFKYFCWIRSYFGISTNTENATSLCPYVQTMLWLSVCFVLTMPMQVIGWLSLKSMRWLYKVCESKNWHKVVDKIDSTALGQFMKISQEDLALFPFVITMTWFVITFIFFAISFALIIMLTSVVTDGLEVIPYLPSLIWKAVLLFGWCITWLAAIACFIVIGICEFLVFLVQTTTEGIVWLFTAGWLWILICKILIGIVVLAIVSFVIGWLSFRLVNAQWFRNGLNFILMQFNGYNEAREAAERRRQSMVLETTEDVVTQPLYRRCKCTSWIFNFLDYGFNYIEEAKVSIRNFLEPKTKIIGGVTYKVITPLGIVWMWLIALKQQACPLVQFVDIDGLDAETSQETTVVEPSEETKSDA